MSATYYVKALGDFTVKIEYEAGGLSRERILSTDQFNVAYDNRPLTDADREIVTLGIYQVPRSGIVVLGNPYGGAESMAFTFGMIYVMNRDGKTVAKYKLADRPSYEGEAQDEQAPKGAPGQPSPGAHRPR